MANTDKRSDKRKKLRSLQPPTVALVPDALLTPRTVDALAGMSASTRRQKVADGDFPKPVIQVHRCTRWRAASVIAWLQRQGV